MKTTSRLYSYESQVSPCLFPHLWIRSRIAMATTKRELAEEPSSPSSWMAVPSEGPPSRSLSISGMPRESFITECPPIWVRPSKASQSTVNESINHFASSASYYGVLSPYYRLQRENETYTENRDSTNSIMYVKVFPSRKDISLACLPKTVELENGLIY